MSFSQIKNDLPLELYLLKRIYNNGVLSSNKKEVKWHSEDGHLSQKFGNNYKDYVTEVVFFDSLTIDGEKRIVMLTQTTPIKYDCQFCSPLLNVAVFSKKENDWIILLNKSFARYGNWGKASDIKLEKIGDDKYGFWFFPGGTIDGITFESSVLYSFVNGDFKQIFEIKKSYEDNYGQFDETENNSYKYSSEINYINTGTEFYNIKIVKKGKKIVDNKLKQIKTEKIYFYRDGIYVQK